MRKTLRFARREYKSSVKSKGFIIGLVLAPIFMSGSLIAFLLLKDRVDVKDKQVAVIDRSGKIAQTLVKDAEDRNAKELYDEETGKKVKPAYFFRIVKPKEQEPEAQRLELSNQIRRGELHGFVEIGPEVVHPGRDGEKSRVAYYAKNAAMDDLRGWLSWPINKRLRELRLADADIDEKSVGNLFDWAAIEGMGLVSEDTKTGEIKEAERSSEVRAIIVPLVMMMLMFLMIMMSVSPLVSSVMEEKMQRIAEVLLGSIKPFEFMMGKLLGSIGVSLTASSVYVIGGIIFIRRMGFTEYIPYHLLPWFFAYMLLAITMLGAMSAALGSTCSEPKDAQSLTFPSIMPAMIPMFVIMPVIKEPQSGFAIWLSFCPPFTPFIMLIRQSTPGGVPFWHPWVGLLGVIAFTLLTVWAGGRIFRVAILMQGTPPKLANIVRWAIRG